MIWGEVKDGWDGAMPYESITRGIRISVEPDFLEEESEPSDDHYVWAYTVRIDNVSDRVVTLKTRVWYITDAGGQTVTVTGDGVVGEQPVLRPGDAFEYTSGTPLTTPSGMMRGVYHMETDAGEIFEADVPAFSLDSPHDWHRLN
ncbi:Co2+/Mg2+ efflux protein ApaG [Parvularcula dongshanensis]|uniref:Protein ApaG n=1 Tax=Parvularcula dongshanensis TaxID=1173995 RepID=A0A840HZK8_9PROT|nr:Co2+/Mg2+ efflux protein ApaG [Parvularcula dongshanensis]MBB4658276.1 ApaG protein [Parvularcula dongshanensis]